MSSYLNFQKKYWNDLASLDGFRPVLDPKDEDGQKNLNLSKIHHSHLVTVFDKPIFADKKSVIDFGSGVGRNVDFLVTYFSDYTGVDQSEEMLVKARENHPEQEFFHIEDGNLDKIDLPAADVFFSFWVFQHVIEDQDLLDILLKAYNLLNPNGLLVFCERSSKVRNEHGQDIHYINHRSPKEYEKLCREAGYRKKYINKVMYREPSFRERFQRVNENGENIYVFQK
ncbi:MAG: class I SAM-dependent methyltransferase [Cytophagales bacterium]|nr:class I SAM-dependent methyltransferase [Cytophagales bacterium]